MTNYREELETLGVSPDAVEGLIDQKLQQLGTALHAANRLQHSPNAPAITRLLQDPVMADRFTKLASVDTDAAIDWATIKAGGSPSAPPAAPSSHGGNLLPGWDFGPQGWEGPRPSVEQARQLYHSAPSRRTAELYAKSRLDQVISDEFLNQ
jgi:hypothetical protein